MNRVRLGRGRILVEKQHQKFLKLGESEIASHK